MPCVACARRMDECGRTCSVMRQNRIQTSTSRAHASQALHIYSISLPPTVASTLALSLPSLPSFIALSACLSVYNNVYPSWALLQAHLKRHLHCVTKVLSANKHHSIIIITHLKRQLYSTCGSASGLSTMMFCASNHHSRAWVHQNVV
jgi:hypothetical protein